MRKVFNNSAKRIIDRGLLFNPMKLKEKTMNEMIEGTYHNDTMKTKPYEKSYTRINQIISETIHKHLRNILTESQESKSIDAAKKLYMERTKCSREEADEFVRITLRNDLPILRKPNAAKFILGVTRMFLDRQITDQRTISQLNTTLEYVSSDAHINEYDRNLNGMSAQDLIQRFAKAVSDDFEKNKSDINSMNFERQSQYDIVRIDSFKQAQQYGQYTSWCVTHNENMFNSYTNNGIGQFYFCLRNGFENEEAVKGENCPLDNYGLSMIAVSVDENGRLNTCTCRWNHDNGGNDSIMNPKQISEVIGMNFYQTFKPNNKWKDVVDNCIRRLANGEDPNDVFDDVSDFNDGFARVKLTGKWNFINTRGELLWKGDKWFDDCSDFNNGFAKVKLTGKYNFINTRGELLSNEGFDYCFDFNNGFAIVELNDKWNFINTRGELLWKGDEWFDTFYSFNNGFAKVQLNDKWNFINTRGELLWKGDEWFDTFYSFNNGFAKVQLNDKWNFINTRGELLWKGNEWFDLCNRFREDFAAVQLNDKYNFINTRGELLWKGDEWFDMCSDFYKKGFAKVELNGRAFRIDTKGQLHNLHESKQRTLRLTESDFRKLIKESVRKTLCYLTT